MPSILVVEHEGRYIERIQQALSSEGWRPRFVAGRPEALRAAASEAPDLVLVNAELPGAPELLRAFARRHGGPGAVALVGERGGTVGLDSDADDLLAKPFSDQELRLVVRRRLAAAASPAPAPPPPPAAGEDDHKLTSQEIFGDLLAEVEGEMAAPAAAAGGAGAGAQSPGSAEAPIAPPPAAAPRSRDRDDDVELRLERTLSGVPGLASRRAAAPGGGDGAVTAAAAGGAPASVGAGAAAPPAQQQPPRHETPDGPPPAGPPVEPPPDEPARREPPREEPPPPAPLPPEPPHGDPESDRPPQGDPPPARRAARSLRPDGDDVDELLNMTLTGLELGPRAGRRAAPAAGAGTARAARPRTSEIDLSEIEALAGVGRRRAPRADAPAAGPPPLTAEPPAAPAGSGVPDQPGEAPPAAELGAPAEPTVAEGTGTARADAGGPDSAGPEEVVAEAATPAPPPTTLPAAAFPAAEGGRRFGHYTLLERIAVGGMAEVWKARMSGVEGFQKTVAIKRILPHMNDDADFVDMFIDEAKLAAQLNHPNITHIYDLGKIGDDFYIAMEFVDGRNLRAILNESRRKALPLPVGFGLVVASRLASALDHAHRKRDFDDRQLELVHRDVSPQNVLISIDGDIKLCDFGISKAVAKVSQTETGALKGKLQYMSPEQAWGRAVDARSDIFSLGALTFEMLTGERLFTGDSEISVLEAVRECRARGPRQVNPAVPSGADAVVRKALSREPEARYQTAGEMQQAIEEILYQLRPTPNQSDVAAFLVRLEQAPEVKPGSRVDPASATASRAGSAAAWSGAEAEEEGQEEGGGEAGGDGRSATAAGAAAGGESGVDPAAGDGASGAAAAMAGGAGTAGGIGTGERAAGEASTPGTAVGATGTSPGQPGPGTATADKPARGWWPFRSGEAPAPPPPNLPEGKLGAAALAGSTAGAASPGGAATPLGVAPSAAAGGRGSFAGGAAATAPPASPSPPAALETTGSFGASGPPATGAAAADSTHTGTSVPRGEAIAARGEVPADDAAGRGRWWLIAAILLLVASLVVVWLWLGPNGTATDAAAPASEPAPAVTAAPPPDPVTAPPASDAPAAGPDLEKLVDEQLAATQEELRTRAEADYQERARRIREQIEALERAEERPATPPPAPDAAPDDEAASPPPPSAGASGAAAAGGEGLGASGAPAPDRAVPARLVSSGQAQYPAAARSSRHEAPTPAGTSRRG